MSWDTGAAGAGTIATPLLATCKVVLLLRLVVEPSSRVLPAI